MAIELPFRLILASGSLGRRELLKQAGYTFEIKPADIDEPTEARLGDCRQYVQEVCWLKANAVAPLYDDAVVLTADSVGWIDGKVIGKPEDEDDARRIIKTLSGRPHELWTGVTLWHRPSDRQYIWQECSVVEMKALTDQEIGDYLATRRWQGCSGAYSISENDPYLTVMSGTLSNVIGLPMESLAEAFDAVGKVWQ